MKNAKQLILFLNLFIGVFFIRCTDKELYEPIKKIAPMSCFDGIINANELDVDCGGDCLPCGTIAAPCNPDTNKVTYDSTYGWTGYPNTVKTFTVAAGGSTVASAYQVDASSSSSYVMHIRLPVWDGRPTVSRAYNIVYNGTLGYPDYGQAEITVDDGSFGNPIYASAGKLYVTATSTKLIFTFCNTVFSWHSWSTGSNYVLYYKVSGRIANTN